MTMPNTPEPTAPSGEEQTVTDDQLIEAVCDASHVLEMAYHEGVQRPEREQLRRKYDAARNALASRLSALHTELERTRRDTERLDWLEGVLNIGADPVEVFFAGLRSSPEFWAPEAYQVELESASKAIRSVRQGDTLRAAIDNAMPGSPDATTRRTE